MKTHDDTRGSLTRTHFRTALTANAIRNLPAGAALLALAACSNADEQSNRDAHETPGVYTIAVTAGTASALPKCTSSLAGTTAYV
jgi:hypothetical protein